MVAVQFNGPRRGLSARGRKVYPSGRVAELLSWLRPNHLSILDPDQFSQAAPIVSGPISAAFAADEGDFSNGALTATVSGAATNAEVVIPLPAAYTPSSAAYPRKAGGVTHWRIRCSNWQAVTSLRVGLGQDAGAADRYQFDLVEGGKSIYGCTNPSYADAWNGKYRTFPITSSMFAAVGSPAQWGGIARYFAVRSVYLRATTTGDVVFKFDRVYSPDWPAAAVCSIFDGWYESAYDLVMREFVPRGWGAGGSRGDMSLGAISTTPEQVIGLAQAGYDVFVHGSWAKSDGSRVGMQSSTPEHEFTGHFSDMRRILQGIGCSGEGLRWHQFLQNRGVYAGSDMGGILRRYGVDSCRRATSDAEWGVDPWSSSYDNWLGRYTSSWVQAAGPMNWHAPGAFENIAIGADYDAPGVNASEMTYAERVEYAALSGNALMGYHHQFVDPPPEFSSSTKFAKGMVAHYAELERHGKIVLVSPSELMQLMQRRPGDVYMRWDGEWVYRHDPTRIAF